MRNLNVTTSFQGLGTLHQNVTTSFQGLGTLHQNVTTKAFRVLGPSIRMSPQAFRVLGPSISLPLHSSKRITPIFTVCLIRIHYLTLFVVYNYMMPWPRHCRIRQELIHHKRIGFVPPGNMFWPLGICSRGGCLPQTLPPPHGYWQPQLGFALTVFHSEPPRLFP